MGRGGDGRAGGAAADGAGGQSHRLRAGWGWRMAAERGRGGSGDGGMGQRERGRLWGRDVTCLSYFSDDSAAAAAYKQREVEAGLKSVGSGSGRAHAAPALRGSACPAAGQPPLRTHPPALLLPLPGTVALPVLPAGPAALAQGKAGAGIALGAAGAGAVPDGEGGPGRSASAHPSAALRGRG